MGPTPVARPPGAAPAVLARAIIGFAAAGVLATAAPPLAGQVLSGTLMEGGTGRPLGGAQVTLRDTAGGDHVQELTDSIGEFALRIPRPGTWVLAVELLGYQSLVSGPVEIGDAELVVVEITLDVHAIPLEPLVVTARRSMRSPDIASFYERRDRAGRAGFGRFVVRDQIDANPPARPTDLVRSMAGIRIVSSRAGRGAGIRMAGGCVPAIYIDGMHLNRFNVNDSLDDYVSVMDIEGIEVYRGPSSQVGSMYDPRGCGLIAVWTRRGEAAAGSTFSWRKLLTVLGGVVLVVFLLN